MMNKLIFILILLSISVHSGAKSHFSTGVHKALKDVQDSKGNVEDKPFSSFIAWGYHFKLFESRYGFSPQIGYIHNKEVANDSFGDQKVHTFFLNWDFLYVPEFSDQFAFRFGIGNFIKRISGEGGTVEIPNGGGTDLARRPSKTVTSYSSTFNFGADYNFNVGPFGDYISDLGLRFELFTFRPLSQENRNYAFNLGVLIYY